LPRSDSSIAAIMASPSPELDLALANLDS
jgi:hypothetical protein